MAGHDDVCCCLDTMVDLSQGLVQRESTHSKTLLHAHRSESYFITTFKATGTVRMFFNVAWNLCWYIEMRGRDGHSKICLLHFMQKGLCRYALKGSIICASGNHFCQCSNLEMATSMVIEAHTR
jgi:uncharacterized protein (AIM24 family)